MTDRPDDTPGDDAPDLTDAQLEAATHASEAEVEEDAAGGETMAEAELVDEELAEDEEAEEVADDDGMPAAPPVRVGARQRAAEAAAQRAASAGRGPKTKAAQRTAFAIDPALRIKDPASAIFVVGSIALFVVIFLNAMAFGHGGAFNPIPTPTPFVSAAPTASPAASPAASGSAAPSTAPSVAPSAAPSVAPSAAPSAAAS